MNLLTVKKNLFNSELTPFQEVQFRYITSILEKVLIPILCDYSNLNKISDQITDIEKFYLGFKPSPTSIVEKLSAPLYIINRFFIASSGPRFGSVYEDLVKALLENRKFKVNNRVNIYKHPLFAGYVNKAMRKDIDFVVQNNSVLYLIEQRTSEQSGGRTSQEALLDKFKVVLDWINKSIDPFLSNGINEVRLIIFISFSERHEILNNKNVSSGRINSLISYIIENLEDKFKLLINSRFNTNCSNFETCLKNKRRIEFYKKDFKLIFEILLGEEFFSEMLGENYGNVRDKLLNQELGDDLWLIYTILPYELRYYYEKGFTWTRKIYEKIKSDKQFKKIISKGNIDYMIEYVAKKVINGEKDLRLLETNDLGLQYEYLKALCGVSLIIYSLGCPLELKM
jgi:hypothetical protein